MTWIIGTDEAGYGPNLGPLCVGASCWHAAGWETRFTRETPNGVDCNAPSGLSDEKRNTNRGENRNVPGKAEAFPWQVAKNNRKSLRCSTGRLPTLFDDLPIEDESNAEQALTFPVDTEALILHLNETLAPICGRRGIFPLIDSKKLYHSTGGIAPLERSVLIALLLLPGEQSIQDFNALVRWICDEKDAGYKVFCEDMFNPSLPFDPNTGSWESLRDCAQQVRNMFRLHELQLFRIVCKRVQPEEFNFMLSYGLKSDLLARVTLGLVRNMLNTIDWAEEHESKDIQHVAKAAPRRATDSFQQDESRAFEPVIVLCDKLGGRNNYRRELEEHFPDFIIEVVEESRALSRYWLFHEERQMEIRFQMKGEANIPTALASIFDKYLRELSMCAFNDWWSVRVPGLVPTAGYPVDAKRFMSDIEEVLSREKIPESVLWREK